MAQDPLTKAEEELLEAESAARASTPDVLRSSELRALLDLEVAPPASRAIQPGETRLPSAARASEPSPHAAFLVRRHFAALDGLRALGILAVVWHHTMGGPGRFGANLFFLLSGFLVTTVLIRERSKKGVIDVARFRARRARRLYPLYFTVLAAYVALVWLLEPTGPSRAEFFGNLPSFATFTSNLFVGLDGEHVIFYFAWSLAAQEQFYLAWPLLLKHATRRACALGLVVGLALVYATRAGVLDSLLPPGNLVRGLVLAFMPALGLGALLALFLDARRGFEALRAILGARWASSALLAAALVLWRTPAAPEPLMHATLWALAAACVLREDHWLARCLRLRAVVHVGAVSYGIYLMHMLCHNLVERGLARLAPGLPVLDFALTAGLALGVATLSQRFFESRFLPPDKRVKRA